MTEDLEPQRVHEGDCACADPEGEPCEACKIEMGVNAWADWWLNQDPQSDSSSGNS